MRFPVRMTCRCCLTALLLATAAALAQTLSPPALDAASGQLSLQVVLDKVVLDDRHPVVQGERHPGRNSSGVVVWLEPSVTTPAASSSPASATASARSYVLVQKNKQFLPHLLVVPVGSSVDFPNEDPFFHNVFSLFNGRRFDLGLYESHTHRAVRFDREGVSYIFCNIHPQMGAVIVALRTPYFAISSADGMVTLSGLPAGVYRLRLWAEDVSVEELDRASRQVTISARELHAGTIHLAVSGDMMAHHANKFGTAYPLASSATY